MKDVLQVVDRINQMFEQFKMIVLKEAAEAKQLEQFQLTPQQELMMFYIVRNEPVTASHIATFLDISMSAVSHVLPKLEEQHLIVRHTNPENRRESFIRLGERGREYAALLHRIDEMMVRKYYSNVSLEELEQVLGVLTKLVEAAKSQDREESR
jgi:DNA-binding MarR family transcriptional regulator